MARVGQWVRVGPLGGLAVEDVPANPLQGSADEVRARFARGIEAPTPRPLTESEEAEAA